MWLPGCYWTKMKFYIVLCICCLYVFQGVGQENNGWNALIRPEGANVLSRIVLPQGYMRIEVKEGSFGEYLRNLPLRSHGSKVCYFDGGEKRNRKVYCAVVDLDIGNRDLQQCADAVIRLRAEYLYHRKAYDKIHFNFTNGFRADYTKWAEGYRISVKGNQVSWYKAKEKDYSYPTFRAYLNVVFAYAGTLSLAKELVPVSIDAMQIGDVFIQGGSPGHAVIVIDMAIDKVTGNKLYLLAQSYMPAQDIHVLNNLQNGNISPWYDLKSTGRVMTPEWTFVTGDLKRFKD